MRIFLDLLFLHGHLADPHTVRELAGGAAAPGSARSVCPPHADDDPAGALAPSAYAGPAKDDPARPPEGQAA